MGKHKRADSKHRLAGAIGKPAFTINNTTDKERKLKLERGKVFSFAPAITAEASPISGIGKSCEAIFSRAVFDWSDGATFFFRGNPINKKAQRHGIMSFGISEKELLSRNRLEVGASLSEGGGIEE